MCPCPISMVAPSGGDALLAAITRDLVLVAGLPRFDQQPQHRHSPAGSRHLTGKGLGPLSALTFRRQFPYTSFVVFDLIPRS